MLAFNDQPILVGAGSVSREGMERLVYERYEQFDRQRRATEALEADALDLQEIEQLETRLAQRAKISPKGKST